MDTTRRLFDLLLSDPCAHVLYGTMRNVRGSLEGGLDEARSGRVLWLRRGGLDALVGQRNQREEGGEFRLSDEHLSDFYV